MTAQGGEQYILAFKKIGAIFLLFLGMALTAYGFNDGSTGLIVLGVLLLAGGIVLLALKIARRNSPS